MNVVERVGDPVIAQIGQDRRDVREPVAGEAVGAASETKSHVGDILRTPVRRRITNKAVMPTVCAAVRGVVRNAVVRPRPIAPATTPAGMAPGVLNTVAARTNLNKSDGKSFRGNLEAAMRPRLRTTDDQCPRIGSKCSDQHSVT